jgi:hypothetical protein
MRMTTLHDPIRMRLTPGESVYVIHYLRWRAGWRLNPPAHTGEPSRLAIPPRRRAEVETFADALLFDAST